MKVDMAADVRTGVGKGVARQLRMQGKIPAVLYGQGENVLLALDPGAVAKVVRGRGGRAALISLTLSGASASHKTALLRDYQVDPISGDVLHADFFEVSMTEPIRVKVPAMIVGGTPAGVKEGGVLHHNLRNLHIECLPAAIPDQIEVDASLLEMRHGIHVRELTPVEGIRFLDDADQMVVSVAAPMSEAKLESLLASGAAAEGAAEPEVVGKAKEGAAATPEKGAAGDAKAEKKEPAKEEKKK
jgi:large subunit ribosomal protein L25